MYTVTDNQNVYLWKAIQLNFKPDAFFQLYALQWQCIVPFTMVNGMQVVSRQVQDSRSSCAFPPDVVSKRGQGFVEPLTLGRVKFQVEIKIIENPRYHLVK